jgi:hypothetical protein
MRLHWLWIVAGLIMAIALGSVTTEMDSAKGRERPGDRGAVDAPLLGSPTVRTELQLLNDIALPVTSAASDAALMTSALSAAPSAIVRDAAVATPQSDGGLRLLRTGSGEFTCIPDNPDTRERDPMCLDASALLWAAAWWSGGTPSGDAIGVGYMPGPTTSSSEAPAPPSTIERDLRPHLVIVNAPGLLVGHARALRRDVPYVMWPGTPHAHLMVPLAPSVQLAHAR